MPNLHFRLFARIIQRTREVYILKIVVLAIAFASSILITIFSINEFGYDRFSSQPENAFRVLQRNIDDYHDGNRVSAEVSTQIIEKLERAPYSDSLLTARVKRMNGITIEVDNRSFENQTIHAVDANLLRIFELEVINDLPDPAPRENLTAWISASAAEQYFHTQNAAGRKFSMFTYGDTIQFQIAGVFKDLPNNVHEDFEVLIIFKDQVINSLHFNPDVTGLYGRTLHYSPDHYFIKDNTDNHHVFQLQSLPDIYFGIRTSGEEAKHGDRYSVIILVCITALILFLALSSFVNLTTITLPHRSKELAVKKLAGTSQSKLVLDFVAESAALVFLALLAGVAILVAADSYAEQLLGFRTVPLIINFDVRFVITLSVLLIALTVSPVCLTMRFVRATPNRLLSTDTITFPKLKRVITFIQLGISVFLIVTSIVVRRQINYSLVKEPGQNHDQIVYLNCPAGLTNEGIRLLRAGWKANNPNILDVMGVSQLPDRINSKEIGSEFFILKTDPGFINFFNLHLLEGNWFGPNSSDSSVVTNRLGSEKLKANMRSVLGVVEDINEMFHLPQKPLKIQLAQDYNYNWLCVRVIEVDIRRTVNRLSAEFSTHDEPANVRYLDKHFEAWIDYQDRLNTLSGILTIVSALLSCCAIYGLSVSLVRDKLKQIAVHKLFGAEIIHITWLLVQEFAKQLIIALLIFGPVTYILLNELLRQFVYATKFSWTDPFYPICYCGLVIFAICSLQARSLNRSDFASALK